MSAYSFSFFLRVTMTSMSSSGKSRSRSLTSPLVASEIASATLGLMFLFWPCAYLQRVVTGTPETLDNSETLILFFSM
jgi:hypothetical protein